MWKIENDIAFLDLGKINSRDFKFVQSQGLTLVVPKKNKWDWKDEERWLRSVVVDINERVVSCGWPKFGNYGEFRNDSETLNAYLKTDKEVLFLMKEDGSLCIRSVVNGEVIFRTRGTLLGGDYDEEGNEPFGVRFRRVAENHYPMLLDPMWCDSYSLLFEYVSPDNKVVLNYDKEDLIFLGFVRHDLTIGGWRETQDLAKCMDLNLVELCVLPKDPKRLLEVIKDWEDEGVVARCANSQVMVKVKSASYLAKHRMKNNMNYNFVVEFIGLAGINNEEELVAALSKDDMDFETVSEGVKFYRKYQAALDKYEECLATARNLYESFSFDTTDPVEHRKQFAALACKQDGFVRTLMFALYSNKDFVLRTVQRKFIQMGDK